MPPRKQAPPVSPDERATVRRLHAQGLSRNAIARETGRSTRTISLIATDLGLSFDRSATEAATRAKLADLAEKRTLLAEALTDDALRLTEQMWQPTVVYNFGGRDNTYREHRVAEPPPDDKRALMIAASAAIDRSLRLVPLADDPGVAAARSMLGALADGINRLAREETDTGEG